MPEVELEKSFLNCKGIDPDGIESRPPPQTNKGLQGSLRKESEKNFLRA